MEAYNNFYFVLMARNGFYTDGNNLDIGSTRCSNLNPMFILLYSPRKYYTTCFPVIISISLWVIIN